MKLTIKIEFSGSDNRVDLFVVRIDNGESNFITSLERLKHKYWSGNEYVDVWFCDRYRLCASKTYSVEDVIEALYGDKILDDDWRYD